MTFKRLRHQRAKAQKAIATVAPEQKPTLKIVPKKKAAPKKKTARKR